jgi:hypothetical protein
VLARRPYVLSCLTWDLDDVLLGDRAIAEFSRALFDRMEASP